MKIGQGDERQTDEDKHNHTSAITFYGSQQKYFKKFKKSSHDDKNRHRNLATHRHFIKTTQNIFLLPSISV